MLRSFRRLLLTGTPLQNNLTELWALLKFLMFGTDFADRKEFAVSPASRRIGLCLGRKQKMPHVLGGLTLVCMPRSLPVGTRGKV